MAILIIEDNQKLAQNIARYLQADKYAAVVAYDGETGLEKSLNETYDLIILDLNLPKIDGLTICKNLRQNQNLTPILMLTARAGSEHVVNGLNAGADDYLSKPFSMDEMTARIRALLRRELPSKNPSLESGNINIDTNTHEVRLNNKIVALAPKEYALLEFLMKHKGIAQERTTILEHVWGEEPDLLFSQTVDVHIAYIRKKLGKESIRTVPGKGYLII